MRKIGIIGGGASGLTAAISAARTNPDAQVFVLEQKESAGKKILATGNGRCNLTNRQMELSCYRGENLLFTDSVLRQFGYEDTLEFFDSLGLPVKFRGDYVYPRSDQASSVQELLLMELDRLGVTVYSEFAVYQVRRLPDCFIIDAKKQTLQQTFRADKVILACGGKASATLGSDGSGYALAKSLGHTITPVVPALVQLKVRNHPFSKAAGVRTDARVTALEEGIPVAEDRGELQITAYGISGIPIFQISRYIAMGLYQKKKMAVQVDFIPEYTEEKFLYFLKEHINGREEMCAGDYLTGIFPKKLIPGLLRQAKIQTRTKITEISVRQFRQFTRACKSSVLMIWDTNGFENAQVCAGGVSTREVDPQTLESLLVPGLYLAGELLDVDGICGGYNLQWAWATGVLAGKHAAEKQHGKDRYRS